MLSAVLPMVITVMLSAVLPMVITVMLSHGPTSANRTKPGQFSTLEVAICIQRIYGVIGQTA